MTAAGRMYRLWDPLVVDIMDRGDWDTVPVHGNLLLRTAEEIWPGSFYMWWPNSDIPTSHDATGLLAYLDYVHGITDRRPHEFTTEEYAELGVKVGLNWQTKVWRAVARTALAEWHEGGFGPKTHWTLQELEAAKSHEGINLRGELPEVADT